MYTKRIDILEVQNLTKKFGDFTAVNDISFSLKEGEILGVLGPNGAGKTTTIQMLLGVLTPTAGDIKYFGKNFFKHRQEILEKVNFSSTYVNLMWWLSVKENLHYLSYMYDIPNRKERLEKVVSLFRLEEIYHKEIQALSAGQQTRVNLAKAFLNFPKILLLDEPTASLDVEIAQYIREMLLEQRKEFDVSIILTSHNMAEIEELCDRVIVINHGQIVANDTPHALSKVIKISHIQLVVREQEEKLIEYCHKKNFKFEKKKKLFELVVPTVDVASVVQDISRLGIVYDDLSIEKPSLEEYFLSVVGGGTNET